MHPREALFLSFMVTYCSGERSFSRFTITKNDLKGRHVPGEVVTISIGALRVTKLKHVFDRFYSEVICLC